MRGWGLVGKALVGGVLGVLSGRGHAGGVSRIRAAGEVQCVGVVGGDRTWTWARRWGGWMWG